MEKTISVIIPIFNQQRFVERCLRSILNQTLSKTIYDIIVIDDGSTDNTKKILENYKDKIKILSNKKNIGLPYSLNKGIKALQAQYIVRLDSDDYVNENFLLFLSTFLDMNKVIGAVSCDYMLVDDNEDIYLGGFSQDMDAERPTYWKNCEKIMLQGIDENNEIIAANESSGVVRSIKKYDNKIIAAGTLSYFPGTPCIWVDGIPYVYDINAVGEVWDMIII